jgi:hypothetical protein
LGRRPRHWIRSPDALVAVAWLRFFFAPVRTEYLVGYVDIIGEPLTLLFGL